MGVFCSSGIQFPIGNWIPNSAVFARHSFPHLFLPFCHSERSVESIITGFFTGTKAYPGANTSLTTVIANLVKVLLTLVGIVFVALVIYGGFSYLTSGGNEEKIKKGKNTLKAAVIGLVIIITSYTITYFIAGALETPGQTPGSGYQSPCEDSTNEEYVSLNCCEYRFQAHNLADSFCCIVYSDFCKNHKDACKTQMSPEDFEKCQ
jgi:uncharacterized membrane protein